MHNYQCVNWQYSMKQALGRRYPSQEDECKQTNGGGAGGDSHATKGCHGFQLGQEMSQGLLEDEQSSKIIKLQLGRAMAKAKLKDESTWLLLAAR